MDTASADRESPIVELVENLLVKLLLARTLQGKHSIARKVLLPIFGRFPGLAARQLCTLRFDDNAKATPLACLLMAGVTDSDVIESMCGRMGPTDQEKAFQTVGRRGRFPIHEACSHSSDAVVQYLLSQRAAISPALSCMDDSNSLPFDLAMRNSKLQFATKKRILELYPEAVGDGAPFMLAAHHSDLNMMKCLVSLWPPTKTHFRGRYGQNDQDEQLWTLKVARIYCRLLPKLESFSGDSILWNRPAFDFLFKKLSNNRSIEKATCLRLSMRQRPECMDDTDPIGGLQQVLENNKTLRHLESVQLERNHIDVAVQWVLAIDRGVQANCSLQSLSFVAHTSGGSMSVKTTMQRRRWDDGAWVTRRDITGSSRLPLQLVCDGPDVCSTTQVLDSLPRLSSIHTLRMEGLPGLDATRTDKVAALLRSNHQFKHLELSGCKFSMAQVIEALETSTRLQSFDVDTMSALQLVTDESKDAFLAMLQEHNTTLTGSCAFGFLDPRIQHYLDLNRLGRIQVRGTGTVHRRNKLVSLLVACREDSALRAHDNRSLSIGFGLLLENPDLWCLSTHAGNPRKRKAEH
ncbi:expressed unknown protein [Seminavis robusta]|uniref:Uncharacterized protein n=1 Tax=Seminavis robusta TaxID=568900 RepID=A0A9N8EBA1_9STRA|nr:expressed unknown protein [Seminavis robusta]|eukprot:Sro895_g217170.1 n/a (577) ;mRNA; r:16326-18056